MSQTASGKQGRRRGRPTVNQVFDLAITVDQCLLRFGPAGRLCLILGLEGGLAVPHRLQGRLVALLLVGQPLGQAVTLLRQGGKLGLLNTEGSLRPSQLLPQTGVGRCKDGRVKEAIRRSRQGRSDPTAQQSARISGTSPSGCADAPPHEIKNRARTSAFSKVGSLLSQLPSLGVEGGRSKVVVVLQDGQKTKVRDRKSVV